MRTIKRNKRPAPKIVFDKTRNMDKFPIFLQILACLLAVVSMVLKYHGL